MHKTSSRTFPDQTSVRHSNYGGGIVLPDESSAIWRYADITRSEAESSHLSDPFPHFGNYLKDEEITASDADLVSLFLVYATRRELNAMMTEDEFKCLNKMSSVFLVWRDRAAKHDLHWRVNHTCSAQFSEGAGPPNQSEPAGEVVAIADKKSVVLKLRGGQIHIFVHPSYLIPCVGEEANPWHKPIRKPKARATS